MWHVRRIHLEAVGHPEARFDPLTLDFTDARGDPTDSVLWLENMGGKTSWVSLVLSVVRPDRKEFLGALRDQKRLEHYVLGPDTAHVVIEWQRLGPPSLIPLEAPRLVTGQVLQWKERRVDLENATKRLQRRFYGFVADDAMDFDRLPFRMPSGQRRALPDFVDTLARALERGDAQRPTDNHGDWYTWLERHGLDPEVFRYQLLMNADEGAVAEQFQWPDGNAFVRWALPYVVNPTVPEEIATAMDHVRELIGRRGALELEREFCARVGGGLERVAEAHERYVEATTTLGTAFDAATLLAAQLKAGAAKARDRATTAEALAKILAARAQGASADANSCGRQRAEALVVGADLKILEVTAHLKDAQRHQAQQRLAVEAWDAVPLVVEVQELGLTLKQARRELNAHRNDTQPLREAEAATAVMLARRLTDLRDRARGERDVAQALAKKSEAAEGRAQGEERAAEAKRGTAIAAESTATSRLTALDEELAAAVAEGLLQPGESPTDGASRRHRELEAQAARVAEARDERERTMTQAQAAQKVADAARAALLQAHARHDAALGRRQELTADEARVHDDPVLVEAAQQAPFDPWHTPEVVHDRLAEAARVAAAACICVEVEAAEDRRAVLHLDQEKLLPPSTDVERALAALEAAGIRTAWSGWQVLRDRHACGARARLVEMHPELANGILVRDATELDRVRAVLNATGLGLPLVVAPLAELARDAVTPERVVLPGPAALHDEKAAEDELSQRTARLAKVEAILRAHRVDEQAAYEAASRYRLFLERWPLEARDQTQTEVVRLEEEVDVAVSSLATAETQQSAADAAHARADQEAQDSAAHCGDARVLAERARDLAKRAEVRPSFEKERQAAAGWRVEAESARERALQDAAYHRTATATALAAAVEAEGRRREAVNQLERHGLGPITDGPVPSEPPDVLERAWRQASAALEQVRRDDVLLAEEQRLVSTLGRLQGDLDGVALEARAVAERLVTQSAGMSAADRTAERQAALTALDAAARAVGACERDLEDARKVRRERERSPKDRSRLDVSPATAAEAEGLAEMLQTRQTQLNMDAGVFEKQRDEHEGRSEAEAEAAKRLEEAATNLDRSLKLYAAPAARGWPLPAMAALPWAGTAAEAEGQSGAAHHRLGQQAQARSEAVERRQQALSEVDRAANDARFAGLVAGGPLRDRLLHDQADMRAAGATAMARQLAQRARSIERDLAQIDEHRQKIAKLLVGQVRSVVLLLQQLQSQSRLPEGLDEWSGRHYLTLRHPGLPDDPKQLAGRVATVVDRACDPAMRQKSDGLTLLYEGLRAAVGGDFIVEILKPGKVLRYRRVPVAEIRTFSGGQKITAALVLFAALTRLRELNLWRDHLGRADVGATLILDNPIGKASAGTLIEVQRRVAQRCRLQLIYTTGVSDLGALGSFTCVVRLDGKENLRTGAQHVVEAERTIEGVRLVQRRVPPAAAHA